MIKILFITFEEDIHPETGFEKNMKRRRMMVFPVETLYLIFEFAEVVSASTHVEDSVIIKMLFLQEFGNL